MFAEVSVVAGDGVPVIEAVDPPELYLTHGEQADVAVLFRDTDAGVNWMQFDVVSLDCPAGCDIAATGFNPEVELLNEGVIPFINQCINPTPFVNTAVLALSLRDCQGNVSEPANFTFICGPGAGEAESSATGLFRISAKAPRLGATP